MELAKNFRTPMIEEIPCIVKAASPAGPHLPWGAGPT